MKRWIGSMVAASLALCACLGLGSPATAAASGAWPSMYAALEELEDANWVGLTRRQMEEDMDYLYQVLDENYAFFGVVERTTGNNLRTAYPAARKALASCKTDADFLAAVLRYVNLAEGAGHMGVIWYDDKGADNAAYQAASAKVSPIWQQVQRDYLAATGQADVLDEPNVTTRIIEEGKTAYVKINSFPGETREDEKILLEFYRQVSGYENLIIDITDNGGGSMHYYWELIVRPNISEPLISVNYGFIKDGPMTRQHFLSRGYDYQAREIPVGAPAWQGRQWVYDNGGYYLQEAVDQMLALDYPPAVVPRDLRELDYYTPAVISLTPAYDQPLFGGDIYLLVSEKVYSSSESFANFSKNTGFATLVGTQTGGDGIGSDPIVFHLPNSGIQLRYAPVYGTTVDGRNSEEYGTTPDIPCRDGQASLDACLAAIAAKQQP